MTAGGIFTGLFQGFFFSLVSIFFIWLAKIADDRRTRDFDDDEHIDNGNLAVGLRRGGLYLGIALGLSGALDGPSVGFFTDTFHLIVDGVLVVGFLFLSRFINDFLMLGHVSNDEECVRQFILEDGRTIVGNTAVGLVEAGMYIATGLILKGSLSGGGGTFFQSLGSAVLFFILGQLALLIFGFLYELATRFNIRDEIKKNNPAAGLSLGGILIALGVILMGSVSGPFLGWGADVAGFFVYTVYGIILLLAFRLLIDRLLLPTTNMAVEITEDQNVSAMVVVECAMTAVALVIAFAM